MNKEQTLSFLHNTRTLNKGKIAMKNILNINCLKNKQRMNAKKIKSFPLEKFLSVKNNSFKKINDQINVNKDKHNKRAKFGWYRYDVRFAIPVYENDTLTRYNVFTGQLLVNHAENGKKYLYDILGIKKRNEKPATVKCDNNPFLDSFITN